MRQTAFNYYFITLFVPKQTYMYKNTSDQPDPAAAMSLCAIIVLKNAK